MTERQRADVLLVARGLFTSRAQARAAIEAGTVRANGIAVGRPSDLLDSQVPIEATPAHPFVSRGGVKLDGALKSYPIAVEGHVCLDVGASTGGFTDVLLRHGAAHVIAVDVGHGQFDARLRADPRVTVLERTDIRALVSGSLTYQPDIAVIDVSFISLERVLPQAIALLRRPAALLALIKPQFEVGRSEVKKGIVRDAKMHDAVCAKISALAASLGCRNVALLPSSIDGGDGNREFFLGARLA